MIYATARQEVERRRKAFIRKCRLKHRAVADSLEEAGERLFTFARAAAEPMAQRAQPLAASMTVTISPALS